MSPLFFVGVLLELLVLSLTGKLGAHYMFSDAATSISAGVIMRIAKMVYGGFELALYTWVYSKVTLISYTLT